MRISDWSSDVCSSDLAGNQHPAARCRNTLERCPHRVDLARVAGELLAAAKPFAQARDFTPQALGFGSSVHQQQQTLRLERFFDEVHSATADRRHRSVYIAVPRKNDHRKLRLARLEERK